MSSMLELPRELYLMVCSYLKPTELTQLSRASRDHYLAAQQPLYNSIRITGYGRLIKLVDTLRKVPVVSTISSQQRLRWYKLSDAQLRERDIKYLDLVLDSREEGHKITGAILSNCIGAVARKCYNVKISLTLNSVWPEFETQLRQFALLNVTTLTIYLGPTARAGMPHRLSEAATYFELLFSGSTFPDLKRVYFDTAHNAEDELPDNLLASVGSASRAIDDHYYMAKNQQQKGTPMVPFYALRRLEEIVLAHNNYLDREVMQSLFGSEVIPQNLKKLEIVDCPHLHPVKHLAALATLLQRSLQLVQHLKLHFCALPRHDLGHSDGDALYTAHISEHPHDHPCNIIRALGQDIKHLDVALAFVCSKVFTQPTKKARALSNVRDYPSIPTEPYETLPERLHAKGYKYRRLISWHGVCARTNDWQQMMEAASEQAASTSWEVLFPCTGSGFWTTGGCLPMELETQDIMSRPFQGEGGGAVTAVE